MLAARVPVIDKRHIRPHKHIVLQPQPIPHLHAKLHRHPVADDHVILDQNVRADIALRANPRAWQDDHKLPDASVGSDVGGLAVSQRMNVVVHKYG